MSHRCVIMVPVEAHLEAVDFRVAQQEARDLAGRYAQVETPDGVCAAKVLSVYEDKALREPPFPPRAA